MQQFKSVVSIIVFLTAQFICPGQNKNINQNQLKRCSVKTINFEQGLMNNQTNCMLTDRLGFTWVSTITGMQRFNGYLMENINPVVDHDTIIINYPVVFFPLQNGNIWISYDQGILEYDPLGNTFQKLIKVPARQKGYLPVIPLLQNTNGIWCMYAKKGIAVYKENKQLDQPFGNDEVTFVDSILHTGIFLSTRMSATNGNDIFLTDARRILQINTTTSRADYLQSDISKIHGLECNKDKLYIIAEKMLASVSISNGKIDRQVSLKEINDETVSLAQVYLVNNNQLLVTINRHLYEFDTACIYQKEFTSLTGDPVVATGFIQFIYADRFKRIWLMTNDDIKLIQNIDIPFSHYIYPNIKRNFIKCIYNDEQKNRLLAGCFNGGIQLYDTSGNPLWDKPVITGLAKDIVAIEKLNHEILL